MPVHSAFQLVSNQERKASATPCIVFVITVRTPFIPFQMDEKISFTPVHAWDQFPVKMPMKISSSPVSTPSTVSRIVAIMLNAPSNIGARIVHKPSHTVLINAAISEKLIPRAESRSLTPSTNPLTAVLILSHVLMIASRNPSLVFHKCTNAATRTAITATTARTGAETPPRAAPSFPMIPWAPETAVFSFPKAPASFTKPCMAIPIFEIHVPRITRNGPRAATKSPTFRMAFLWLSDMPFSLSTKPWTAVTIFRIAGMSMSPKEMASSSN